MQHALCSYALRGLVATKNAKFPRCSLSAGGTSDFIGLGDLGVLAVRQIGVFQEKTMRATQITVVGDCET